MLQILKCAAGTHFFLHGCITVWASRLFDQWFGTHVVNEMKSNRTPCGIAVPGSEFLCHLLPDVWELAGGALWGPSVSSSLSLP